MKKSTNIDKSMKKSTKKNELICARSLRSLRGADFWVFNVLKSQFKAIMC